MLIAALGMGVPVVAGLLPGYRDAGFTLGHGAILLAGAPSSMGQDQEGSRPLLAVPPALLAVAVATPVGGRTWSNAAVMVLVSVAGLLSGYSRPLAIARSYLLYSVIITPLILLVLDLGRPIELALLSDRLVATLAGGAIVIAGNIAFDRLLERDSR